MTVVYKISHFVCLGITSKTSQHFRSLSIIEEMVLWFMLHKDGTITAIHSTSSPTNVTGKETAERSGSSVATYETKEDMHARGISVDNTTTIGQHDTTSNIMEQTTEDQQALVLDAATGSVIEVVYSGSAGQVTEDETPVSTIDVRQASELAQMSQESIYHQTSQGRHSTVKTITSLENTQTVDHADASEFRTAQVVSSVDSESMTLLEQDIAQTLIQINPLSWLHQEQREES